MKRKKIHGKPDLRSMYSVLRKDAPEDRGMDKWLLVASAATRQSSCMIFLFQGTDCE
jgi:hypothetical protein